MMTVSRSLAAFVLTATLVGGSLAPTVSAAPSGDAAAAANAYQEAQKAELSRDHLRAAEMFELADSILPSPEALRAAIRNYETAGRKDLAASLAWTLRQRYDDEKSRGLAEEMLEEYEAELLSIDVQCETPCTVSSEGRSVSHVPATQHRVFLAAGEHDLAFVFGKELERRETVAGDAGDRFEVDVERPPDPEPEPVENVGAVESEPPPGAQRRRLSPTWFVVGAVATAGLGGAAAWSGSDVLAINERYEDDPTQVRLDNGQSAELRTNVLIGATAAVGVTTIVLAVFTDWGRWKNSNRSARASLSPWVGLQTRSVGVGGRF